jgi:hypothetical protein
MVNFSNLRSRKWLLASVIALCVVLVLSPVLAVLFDKVVMSLTGTIIVPPTSDATATFVFINDYGGFDVLADNLDEVISSMTSGSVTHAVLALGYWDFKNGQVTVNAGYDENNHPITGYGHDASFYTNVINQMHAAGLEVIAWMMDGACYDDRYGQCNLNPQYLPQYLPYVKEMMDMGFDGFCDDIEYWVWTDNGYWTQWAAWENALTEYLHDGTNFNDGKPRTSAPACGIYNDIADGEAGDCVGELLTADYNLIMFYVNEMTDPSVGSLWYPEVLGQYTADPPVAPPDETAYPANPFTPLTPVIIVLMIPNGCYSEINGYTVLDQLDFYTDLVPQWEVGELAGFGIWVWENMNYLPYSDPIRPNPNADAYWSAWNTFVTTTLPSYGVPTY